jgi:predicted lysophospholipase L1 biosynthesis ABC-type transport system permease subunit
MRLTLILALRYLRRGCPLSAITLAAITPAALVLAVSLASRLGDLPARIQWGVSMGLVILAAWLGLTKALMSTFQARATELTSLREIGATPAQTRGVILMQALLLSGSGTLLGLLIGLGLIALTGGRPVPSLPIEAAVVAGVGLASGGVAGLVAARPFTHL